MKKLNLKNVKEFAEFKLPIGGFICKIVDAEENESVRSLIEEYEKEIKNVNIEFGEI